MVRLSSDKNLTITQMGIRSACVTSDVSYKGQTFLRSCSKGTGLMNSNGIVAIAMTVIWPCVDLDFGCTHTYKHGS